MLDHTGFDFETHRIGPGNMAPSPVAGGFSQSRSRHATKLILRGDEMFERLRTMYRDEKHVGQNVAYDNVVAMFQYPELTPLIFDAYHEQRVSDVAINEGLFNLSVLGEIGPPEKRDALASLSDLAKKYRGLDLSADKGSDGWRLRYHELDGIPLEFWPADARDYLKGDAWLAREIKGEQEQSPVEWLHVAGAFCYRLMTVRGLKIDRKRTRWLWAKVEKELSPEALPLLYKPMHGALCPGGACECPSLVRPATGPLPYENGAKDHVDTCKRPPKKAGGCSCPVKLKAPQAESVAQNEVLRPLVMKICAENNMEIPYTDKSETYPDGQVKTDEETIARLAGFDDTLGQYHVRMESDKLRTSYFPAMCWPYGSKRVAPVMYPGYEPLKKTGRGSSRGNSQKSAREGRLVSASANIQQADPRMRACYRPRDGYVYVVADFSAIDLVNLAQTVFRMFGKNNLTDHVNAGIDLHGYLATAIAFKKDPKFAEKVRGRKDLEAYKIFKDLAEAPHAKGCTSATRELGGNCGVGGCFYKKWRDLAKKAGLAFAGGMGIDTFIGLVARELKMKLTVAEAKALKKLWLQVYPVMKRYLDWAAHNVDNEATGDFNKFYVSPLGMRRTRCSYTECANGNALQSPAAEGMKLAMFLVTRECYVDTVRIPALHGSFQSPLFGCRPVINMHDELVVEAPIVPPPGTAHGWNSSERYLDAVAKRLSVLMVKGQKKICPDVKVEAKPFVTTRWVKEAKQVVKDGLIVPWVWTPGKGDHDGE